MKKIKWWEKIILWFIKPYVGYDLGSSDGDYFVVMKRFRGKIYIVDEGVV